jgi:hypothetical protein
MTLGISGDVASKAQFQIRKFKGIGMIDLDVFVLYKLKKQLNKSVIRHQKWDMFS